MARAWLIRPVIVGDRRNLASEFISNGYISTGPNFLPRLQNYTVEQIKKRVMDSRAASENLAAGVIAASVNNFANRMQDKDVALIVSDDEVYAIELEGDYYYVQNNYSRPGFLCHRRNIKLYNTYTRQDLSLRLRGALRKNRQIAEITEHYNEVYKLVYGELPAGESSVSKDTIPVTYPLRPDFNISFSVPSDMTRNEAERFEAFIKTIFFKEDK